MTDIFKDKTPCTEDGNVVRTVMIPSESRDATIKLINRSVEEKADVVHVRRPRFGHGY